MTSYQITEDLLVQDQGFGTAVDVDSDDPDLSSEEDHDPEPDELIQGPSTGFTKRGKQKPDSSGVPKDNKGSKKDQDNITLQQNTQPRKTTVPPPKKESNPANYSCVSK